MMTDAQSMAAEFQAQVMKREFKVPPRSRSKRFSKESTKESFVLPQPRSAFPTKRLNFNAPAELAGEFSAYCKDQGLTQRDVLVALIEWFMGDKSDQPGS